MSDISLNQNSYSVCFYTYVIVVCPSINNNFSKIVWTILITNLSIYLLFVFVNKYIRTCKWRNSKFICKFCYKNNINKLDNTAITICMLLLFSRLYYFEIYIYIDRYWWTMLRSTAVLWPRYTRVKTESKISLLRIYIGEEKAILIIITTTSYKVMRIGWSKLRNYNKPNLVL